MNIFRLFVDQEKSHDWSFPQGAVFLLLNIVILILHYASMQSEIDETDSLKIYIASLELENDKIKVENNKIRAENLELKARVVKLEDKQSQNELIKNLLSVSRKTWSCINLAKFLQRWGTPAKMIFSCWPMVGCHVHFWSEFSSRSFAILTRMTISW